MIGSIRGKVIRTEGMTALIEVQGLGYEVEVTGQCLPLLKTGEEIFLYVHHVVREDAQLLFGFVSFEQRALFRELVRISGIGPKIALSLLSAISVEDFIQAVAQDQVSTIVAIPGIGKKTAIKLHNLNINTIYDLAHTDGKFLYKYFKNQAIDMIDAANGKGSDIVVSEESIPKGIGNETTLSHNISTREELEPYLLALSENVAIRIRKQKKYASVVVVTLKDKFFKRMSHQKKLVNATNLTEEIYKTACEILSEMNVEDGIRLIGVRLDKLSDTSSHQVSLFEDIKVREGNNELEKTVDELKEKYGFKVIKKASLIDSKVGKKYLNK